MKQANFKLLALLFCCATCAGFMTSCGDDEEDDEWTEINGGGSSSGGGSTQAKSIPSGYYVAGTVQAQVDRLADQAFEAENFRRNLNNGDYQWYDALHVVNGNTIERRAVTAQTSNDSNCFATKTYRLDGGSVTVYFCISYIYETLNYLWTGSSFSTSTGGTLNYSSSKITYDNMTFKKVNL